MAEATVIRSKIDGGYQEYLHCIAVAIEFTSQGRKDRIIDYYEVLNVGFSHKVFREGDVTDKDKILRMLDDDIHIDCVSSVWVVSLTPAVPSFAFGGTRRARMSVAPLNQSECLKRSRPDDHRPGTQ